MPALPPVFVVSGRYCRILDMDEIVFMLWHHRILFLLWIDSAEFLFKFDLTNYRENGFMHAN